MPITFSSLNHAMRVPLAAEVHSRPFLQLEAPERVSHLAVYARNGREPAVSNSVVQQSTLAALCVHFGVPAPTADAKHFFHDFGAFRLKWECHSEFATFTFASREQDRHRPDPWAGMPLSHVPQEWIQGLDGKLMVAAHVVLDGGGAATGQWSEEMPRLFDRGKLAGSQVLSGGEVWTDFLIHPDGFSRFLVRDIDLREQQAGRLVQRVLEIETYRMMALLGLPYAQRAVPVLNSVEAELATLTSAMVESDVNATPVEPERDQALLDSISRLAARLEKLSLDNNYRFAASRAYFRLVRARIEELRETRIEGVPTIGEFMDRRLMPAMNTCDAIASRQDALARRIANTNDLLRTRVGIVQERQNRRILQSMNARAAQQLRLQQAVEGLSVAAISYYVVGLAGYVGKALKAAGLPVNIDIATGLLVPVVGVAVWLGLRRMHRKIGHERE